MSKKNEFGVQSTGKTWTMHDFHNNWCLYEQVGQLKPIPPPETDGEMTFHPPMDPVPEEGIQEMLRKAYYSIGGDKSLAEWAKKNPTEFYKLMLRPNAKEVVNTAPSIIINLGGTLGRLVEAERDLLGK